MFTSLLRINLRLAPRPLHRHRNPLPPFRSGKIITAARHNKQPRQDQIDIGRVHRHAVDRAGKVRRTDIGMARLRHQPRVLCDKSGERVQRVVRFVKFGHGTPVMEQHQRRHADDAVLRVEQMVEHRIDRHHFDGGEGARQGIVVWRSLPRERAVRRVEENENARGWDVTAGYVCLRD